MNMQELSTALLKMAAHRELRVMRDELYDGVFRVCDRVPRVKEGVNTLAHFREINNSKSNEYSVHLHREAIVTQGG